MQPFFSNKAVKLKHMQMSSQPAGITAVMWSIKVGGYRGEGDSDGGKEKKGKEGAGCSRVSRWKDRWLRWRISSSSTCFILSSTLCSWETLRQTRTSRVTCTPTVGIWTAAWWPAQVAAVMAATVGNSSWWSWVHGWLESNLVNLPCGVWRCLVRLRLHSVLLEGPTFDVERWWKTCCCWQQVMD